MLGYDTWNALSSGATRVSETLSGAERRKTPATVDIWLNTKFSTASLSSAVRWACSKISASTLGNFRHGRELAPIVNRGIVRPNRDTLYSFAVLDFDADPVTVTLADAGKRFMAMQVVNEDHPGGLSWRGQAHPDKGRDRYAIWRCRGAYDGRSG